MLTRPVTEITHTDAHSCTQTHRHTHAHKQTHTYMKYTADTHTEKHPEAPEVSPNGTDVIEDNGYNMMGPA